MLAFYFVRRLINPCECRKNNVTQKGFSFVTFHFGGKNNVTQKELNFVTFHFNSIVILK